jgi:hypothetical protein
VGDRDIEYVLIELKSPSGDIFEVKTTQTRNGGSDEYLLHKDLSRAIPQILEYKSDLESKNPDDPELDMLGIQQGIKIKKCIIVIGKNSDNSRWKKNRHNLAGSLSSVLEINTYSDLLNKLESTISNIEEPPV